jgi:hypothetical protein
MDPYFLDLFGGELSVSRPGRFTPGKIAPGTHLRGWMGPRAGLEKRSSFRFLKENQKESEYQKDLHLYDRTILE